MPLLQPPLMADALAASRALVYEGARAAALVGLVEAEPESTDLFDEALTTARLVLEGDKVVAEEKLLADRNWRIREVKQGPDGAIYIFAGNRLVRLAPR